MDIDNAMRHPPRAVPSRRRAWLVAAWFAMVLALPFLAVAIALAAWSAHRVNDDERAHLDKARAHVQAFAVAHGRLPGSGEFDDWARRTDAQLGTRFDGLGFGLEPDCARRSPQFCLGFWTGEDWVTYRSWQPDQGAVEIDGRWRSALVDAAASAGLMAFAVAAFARARRAR